jgi:LmbE family N-acetylglucosaminyl deacetylase
MPRPARAVALACVLLLLLLPAATPQPAPHAALDLDRGATGLGLALRRLGVTARVLYVTAHPDDEHNGVLVRLSRGLGVRTALLTVTRGEGGQNAIGPELFAALGVLRTAELDSMHRYDGVEQYFGRAYEFGYSFSVEETFAKWGREETLGDVVRVVRAFRPDVILTLPLSGPGGGQHHEAVGQLARDAFRASADPGRFPDQIRQGLRPWQARKIYVGGIGGSAGGAGGAPVRVETGVYDALLGQTWQQLGSRARALQRCQGARQLVAAPGPADGVYTILDAEPPLRGGAPETDILDGIDTSVTGLARFAPETPLLSGELAEVQARLEAARSAFDATTLEHSSLPVATALTAVRSLEARLGALVADSAARAEIADRLHDQEADAETALARSRGLLVDAVADDGLVTPGETFGVAVSVSTTAAPPVAVDEVVLDAPAGWTVERTAGGPGAVASATPLAVRFRVTVAADAAPTQPYWRRMADRDRNELLVAADETRPWSPPAVVARVRARADGVETTREAPVCWRYEGPLVGGEKRHPVQVVPALSVRLTPDVVPVPVGSPRPVELRAFVRELTPHPADGTVRLEAPPGWRVAPKTAPLAFAYEGEEAVARFTLTPPPAGVPTGTLVVRAVATAEGKQSREAVQAIEYPHIERRPMLRPAETRLLAMPVRTRPGASVGYVMGSGDAIADAVRQLGVPVRLLSAEDLAFSDLSRFRTIVTGIRAYETREDLRQAHGRLMRWVRAGGHLVVQYNRDAFNRLSPGSGSGVGATSPYAPYPAVVTPERISDETTPMHVLAPQHPLLTTPNRISESDWSGWVQERGIQLLDARDPRYVELLAATDPFPNNPGEKKGLLVDAAVGRGTWTYVGLVLFREVPAGVPGGWRLLANLVSRP